LCARLSAPVQTGPGIHPASCRMGNGSFPVVMRPGRGLDHSSSLTKLLSYNSTPHLSLHGLFESELYI